MPVSIWLMVTTAAPVVSVLTACEVCLTGISVIFFLGDGIGLPQLAEEVVCFCEESTFRTKETKLSVRCCAYALST